MKIKLVKNKFLDENRLSDFYEYVKNNDIQIVDDVVDSDLIISFGGDGTTIVAAKETLKKDVPIIAVNMGSLGYLAEIEPSDVVKMLENYRNNKCTTIDERNFLEVNYNDETYYAINDMALVKGGLMSHLIEVEVYANDVYVNKYRADGVIIATPTGSTAYSLSAGGSIVSPKLSALTITPLAPQGLSARAIIVSGSDELKFKVHSRDNDSHLNIDGSICFRVSGNDKITAKLSDRKVRIIKTGKNDYYSVLRKKLKWGETVVTDANRVKTK